MTQQKKIRDIVICVSLVIFVVVFVGTYLGKQSKQSKTQSNSSYSQAQSYTASQATELTQSPTYTASQATETTQSPTVADNSREIYNKNGIKVICLGFDDSGVLPKIAFKIENNSDYDIFVTTDKLSINDYMLSRSLLCTVAKGKKALDGILMFSSDLTDLGIVSISNIDFTLKISESGYYGKSPIDDSELISISY